MRRSEFFGTNLRALQSMRRYDHLSLVRQIIWYELRTTFDPTPSFPQLGRIFGGRDHTTVIHGIQKIEKIGYSDAVEMAIKNCELRKNVDELFRTGHKQHAISKILGISNDEVGIIIRQHRKGIW